MRTSHKVKKISKCTIKLIQREWPTASKNDPGTTSVLLISKKSKFIN